MQFTHSKGNKIVDECATFIELTTKTSLTSIDIGLLFL